MLLLRINTHPNLLSISLLNNDQNKRVKGARVYAVPPLKRTVTLQERSLCRAQPTSVHPHVGLKEIVALLLGIYNRKIVQFPFMWDICRRLQ